MSESLQILIVEDSEDDARLVLRELRHAGFEPVSERVESAGAMRAALSARAWDLILCDYVIPGFGALEALRVAKDSGLDLPFILVSNKVSEETLVEAMRSGATDFLMKDRLERLGPVVRRELADAAARRGLRRAQIEWRTAFDAVQDAVFIHDADFRIVRANLAYATLGGLPIKGVVGKLYWEVFPKTGGPLAGCLAARESRGSTAEEFSLPAGKTYLSRSFPISDTKGNYLYSLHVLQDVTARKQDEHRRLLEAKRLEVSLALGRMLGESEQAVLDFILEECLRITESRYSFIGWINEDESAMTIHAWSKDAMARCAVENMPRVFPLAEAGLWAEPIRQHRTVIVNDCAQPHEHRHGLPAGHVEIKRYLGVPIFERDRIVLIAAVANKESAYAQSDADSLTRVITDAWTVIQRNQAAARIEHLNRLIRSARSINRLITSEKDQASLLQFSCDILVREADYRMVWVGATEQGHKRVVPVAQAGLTEGYLDSVAITWDEAPTGQAPRGTALRTGERSVVQDIESDPRYAPWREAALARGYRASATLPLMSNGCTYGILNVYAGKPNAFDAEEIALLSEVADDIAFALRGMELARERKRAEEALEQSEATLRAIFDAAADGIVLADAQSKKFLTANASICRMLGYSRKELLELDISGIHPEESLQHVARQFERQAKGEIDVAADLPVKRRDGSIFYADVNSAPMAVGGKACVLGIFRDVTERRRAEEALRDSEERLRAISISAQDGIVMADNDGTIEFWNPSAEKLFGYTEQEAIGKRLHELIVPERFRDKARPGFAQFRLTGQGPVIGKVLELPSLRKDGTEFPAEHSISAVKLKGQWHAVAVVRDLTERKRAEADRQQYAERLGRSLEGTIRAVALTVEMRDPYTAGHQRRVADLAVAIGTELGLPLEQIRGLRLAGIIHDLGKIHIPAEILSKPGKLTDIEFSFIKTHPQAGYAILKDVEFPWPIARIVLQHHERLDGRGYPQELTAEQILLEARILAVADVVEAMASHRPYRPALGVDAALNEIIKNRGTQFEPAVVDACVKLFKEEGFAFAQESAAPAQREKIPNLVASETCR